MPVGMWQFGVSPGSGCETEHPSHPFALHSATTRKPRPPHSGSRYHHDVSPAGTVGLSHDPPANGPTAYRMRLTNRIQGSGTDGLCAPLRRHARADACRGLSAFASLSMAGSRCPPQLPLRLGQSREDCIVTVTCDQLLEGSTALRALHAIQLVLPDGQEPEVGQWS